MNEEEKELVEGIKQYPTHRELCLIHVIERLDEELNNIESKRKNGTLSDGYHTYNDLYYQRCILFATICNANKKIAWKSKRHSDGKKCFNSDNWFIVGIDTPKGSYTYHYEMKYWDLFKVTELENGKIWDGHTEKDVTRLLSLEDKEQIYMSEEEQKAIECIKEDMNYAEEDDYMLVSTEIYYLKIALNLIDRLQKDLNKKDEVINRMVEVIEDCRQNGCIEFNEETDLSDIAGEEMVKEYFYKKAEEEK